MSDFKLDVDALFGEQVRYDPISVEQLQRGSRTRPRKTSLTHGRSFMKLYGSHHGLTDIEIARYENTQMFHSETEQTITDKFWGLDKESNDEFYERCEMSEEDDYSAQHELFCKTEQMKKFWEEEELMQKELMKEQRNSDEENARNVYLHSFYATTDSGDIMNYKWPTREIYPPSQDYYDGNGNQITNTNINSSRHRNGFEIWNLVGEPSTIHLDGLQQSRTISLNGETYDPRKTASIADLAMRPAGTRKNKPSHNLSQHQQQQQQNSYSSLPHSPHSPSHHTATTAGGQNTNGIFSLDSAGGGGSSAGAGGGGGGRMARELSIPSLHSSNPSYLHGHSSVISASSPLPGMSKFNQPSSHRNKINLLELHNGKYLAESNKLLLQESSPKYCDLLDGHPLHHWDAIELLKSAFHLLDVLHVGAIRRENISELGNNRQIHHYLRYTLFWMSLKRRKWNFFYSMFDDFEETITVDIWVAVLDMIRYESHVKLSHLRTIHEHKQACAVGTLQMIGSSSSTSILGDKGGVGGGYWMDLLEDTQNVLERKKYYASEQRKGLFSLEREANLLRTLRKGDFIWGLFNKGCVWYPAVVEEVDMENREVSLKYLLSTEEVKKYQSLTISRQYLPRSVVTAGVNPSLDRSTSISAGQEKKKSNTKTVRSTTSPPATQQQQPLILPQSIQTERDLCEYIFDLIVAIHAETVEEKTDPNPGAASSSASASSPPSPSSRDYINCHDLLETLQAPEYHQIVLSSASLTALFHSNGSLAHHLETMFPSQGQGQGQGGESNEEETRERGMISKTEFLQYCDIVKDIFVYNISQ